MEEKFKQMSENKQEIKIEFYLFALAFWLALFLRLLRLGELPLGDIESGWALQALDLTKGLKTGMGTQPAYVLLTGFLFYLFQAGNIAARFFPALFGAMLTLLPFQFKDQLGIKPALILAFLLAFDPGFLALSRAAGSPILAVTSLLFLLAAWKKRNYAVIGMLAGFSLLTGPLLWPGILGLLFAKLIANGFGVKSLLDEDDGNGLDKQDWIKIVIYALATYILAGSMFLLTSGGLSAGLGSLPEYLGGYIDFSDTTALRMLFSLVTYELLAVLLAAAALVRGAINRDNFTITLGSWLIASLVFALVYPSRQVSDLAWPLIPLLVLASMELSRHLAPIIEGKWETISMTVFTAAILGFATLNYFAIALTPLDPAALQLRWYILLGSLGLLLLSIAMVGFGWSISTALQGGIWGSFLVMAFCSLSMSAAAAQLKTSPTFELWNPGPYIGQQQTLLNQLNDLSRWKKGTNSTLEVTIAGVKSPALLWALRDWNVSILDDLNLANNSPEVVIATDQFSSTEIEAVYRGQDFSWRVYPAWDLGLSSDWLKWTIIHDFPKSDEKLILWVRSDVFIDSQNNQ